MRIVVVLVALIVALTSYACGGDSGPTTPTQLPVRFVSVSGMTSFTGSETAQFTAMALLSNGMMEDQTRTATWSSSNMAVVSVSPSGLVTSIGTGTAQINASYQGVSGTKTVDALVAATTPALTATFSSIQREIFESTDSAGRRACTPCHTNTGRNPSGGLNLNHEVAYAQLVGAASVGKVGAVRVVSGDPERSDLIPKLDGRAGIVGGRMPTTPPYLTDEQVEIIRRWIQQGAKNN